MCVHTCVHVCMSICAHTCVLKVRLVAVVYVRYKLDWKLIFTSDADVKRSACVFIADVEVFRGGGDQSDSWHLFVTERCLVLINIVGVSHDD